MYSNKNSSTKTARRWLGRSLVVVVAAALLTACNSDAPFAPNQPLPPTAGPVGLSADTSFAAFATQASASQLTWGPNLGQCENLKVAAGNKLSFHTFATGDQIYRWSGTAWTFVAPSATLYALPGELLKVGTHYAGPTWEGLGGSKVVGAVVDRCTPDATAIPWLLLSAVSTEGPGVFHKTTFIQRVNTVGGLAPSTPGSVVGEEARVPYTTQYFFYRAK